MDKIDSLKEYQSFQSKLLNNFVFIPFGIPILVFDTLADFFYFWKNNFRPESSLKVTIIPKEKTTISHNSIKEIMNSVMNFSSN